MFYLKMRKLILITGITLLTGIRLFTAPVVIAADIASFDAYRDACVKGHAATHKPPAVLGLKPDGANFQSQFQAIDKGVYCKCVFDKYEKTFGRENYVKMRDYRLHFDPPGMNVMQSGQAVSAIKDSCFGAQIGRSDLKPMDAVEPGQRPVPPQVQSNRQIVQTKSALRGLRMAIQMYQADNGNRLPTSLAALAPNYKKSQDLKDAWNQDFVYLQSGSSYRIFSVGPDARTGTSDDIESD